MTLILAFLSFCTVFLVVIGVYYTVIERKIKVHNRLEQIRSFGPGLPVNTFQEELTRPFLTRLLTPVFSSLGQFFTKITPVVTRDQIRNRLLMAGNPLGLEVGSFIVIRLLGPFIFCIPLYLFFKSYGQAVAMLLGVAGLLAGFVLPEFALKKAITSRQLQIQCSLPDVLDLLTVSVEAGLGFDAAIAKVVEKVNGPLSLEFQRLLQEIKLGKTRRDALRDMVNRTQVDDLSSLVAAIVQADQLGVPIGNVLRIQSKQIRQKKRQRAEELAMKAPVKMLLPMIVFIFPVLLIILLGSAVLQLMTVFVK